VTSKSLVFRKLMRRSFNDALSTAKLIRQSCFCWY